MEIKREISTIFLTAEEESLIMQYWEEESPIYQEKELADSTITTEFEKTSIIT
jgi:hypothetical protein